MRRSDIAKLPRVDGLEDVAAQCMRARDERSRGRRVVRDGAVSKIGQPLEPLAKILLRELEGLPHASFCNGDLPEGQRALAWSAGVPVFLERVEEDVVGDLRLAFAPEGVGRFR